VYRPPGQLGSFLEELVVLPSFFPEDGTPLIILGDFHIHLDKPQAANFHTVIACLLTMDFMDTAWRPLTLLR